MERIHAIEADGRVITGAGHLARFAYTVSGMRCMRGGSVSQHMCHVLTGNVKIKTLTPAHAYMSPCTRPSHT